MFDECYCNAAEAIEGCVVINISTTTDISKSILPLPKDFVIKELLVLTIRDNGPGISDEDIQHIFEPFYSRKLMGRSGTGLGLAIVWNTLEDGGGGVIVESGKRETRFHLLLPLTHKIGPQAEISAISLDIQGQEEQILVVDDEQLQRDMAGRMLTSLNYRVTTVSAGEKAIQCAKEQEFDDMVMSPSINGRETYEQILEFKPNQKTVVISGYSASDDIDKVRALGVKKLLLKPYTVEQPCNTLKKGLS